MLKLSLPFDAADDGSVASESSTAAVLIAANSLPDSESGLSLVLQDEFEAVAGDGMVDCIMWNGPMDRETEFAAADSLLFVADWEQPMSEPYVQLCFYKNDVSTILVGTNHKPLSLGLKQAPDPELLSMSSNESTASHGESSVSSLSEYDSDDDDDDDESNYGSAPHFWIDTTWYLDESNSYDETNIGLLHEIASYDRDDNDSHGCAKLLRSLARLSTSYPSQLPKPCLFVTRSGFGHRIDGKVRAYAPLKYD